MLRGKELYDLAQLLTIVGIQCLQVFLIMSTLHGRFRAVFTVWRKRETSGFADVVSHLVQAM